MSHQYTHAVRTVAGYVSTGLLIAVVALLSACATGEGKNVSSFDRLDLAPGDTGNCRSSPCRVTLQMPAGSGSYEVTANQVKLGAFSAGKKADLGNFTESSVIDIQGSDAPKTYVYVSRRL